MKFALVRLVCNKESKGDSKYHSYIQLRETMSALAEHKKFANRQEMAAIMTDILASQSIKKTFDKVSERIDSHGAFDFTGENSLDLTDEQAESLGWPKVGTKK
jgi:hypothetical protein